MSASLSGAEKTDQSQEWMGATGFGKWRWDAVLSSDNMCQSFEKGVKILFIYLDKTEIHDI